jgi:hypothetical protein
MGAAGGGFLIWVSNEPDELEIIREPSVGLSDVIVRLAAAEP